MSAISAFPGYSLPRLSRRLNHRDARIVTLLGAVFVLNIVDLVCTLNAHRFGMGLFDELNPIADTFMRFGLIPSLISFKILMTLCGMGLLWKIRQSRWVLPACWILLIAYMALSLVWYFWMNNASAEMEWQMTNAVPMDP